MIRPSPLSTRDIRLHRQVIYGFAALCILFAHTITKLPSSRIFTPLRWIRFNGASGVEIFVLLSVFGIYRSLERNPDVLAFYRRRFQRVVPCAFIITTISYGLATWVDIPEFFSAITFFPYWLGADTLWYVPFVLTLYLVYPLVHRLQKKCPIVLWVLWAVLLAFSALCCYILVPENSHWLLPIMRFPLFILGCILAPWADGDSPIPRWAAPATLLGYLLITFFWPNYKSDEFARSVSYVFLSGFVIIALTWLARLFTRGGLRRFIYRCFALCGGISLEIYLIYSRLLYFMEKIPAYASGRIGHVKLESVTFVLTIILSLLLNRFCAWLTDSFSKIPVVSDD